MEDEEVSKTSEEFPFPWHKVFIDLSSENDLKGKELEWFKSRICPQEVRDDKEKKPVSEYKKVEILTAYEIEKPPDKPNKVILRLTETDTIWFLSLNTCFSQENEEDVQKVSRENETYQKKKTKKEIIRKRCMADTQTPRCMIKSTGTLTTDIIKKDVAVFASEWDVYDTYNALDKCEISPSKKYLKFKDPPNSTTSTKAVAPTEEEVTQTFNSLNFKYASLVTERLLASNCFQSKQSIFKTDFKTRYYLGPSQFTYSADLLWSFNLELEQPLTVTALEWNPLNEDLLAVGYGDLNFGEGSSGLICVWSFKNPRQPERRFRLEDSVTSLHYSKLKPSILAVGTRVGNVYILDVSVHERKMRILGSGLKPHPGPVWKTEWFLHKELTIETEELLAIGEGGVLMMFSTSIDKDTKDILKLSYVTETRKILDKVSVKKIPRHLPFHDEFFDKKTFSGLCFSICSSRNFCYISTKEGVIVKCNLMNPSMTDAVFLAHDGPVYTIQHSPVTDVVFLTCGADWKIKIWMEGISQPVITLQQRGPVACARWSPTIPTLIASVGEEELSLWDIGRNILIPMTVKKFDDCGKSLCSLLFSSNGANLMIGSEDGSVHVVHLTELPRIPFLQKEALILAIKRVLLRDKDELYDKFRRAVQENKDKLKTKIMDQLEPPIKLSEKERSEIFSISPEPKPI